MRDRIAAYFELEPHGTTIRREILAGVTTFVTMSYIIAVNPAILQAAGIPEGPSMVATIASAVFGTLAMGLYANRPFAIAPYMGENAFIAFTVVRVMGYRWEAALGAVLIAGVLFTALTFAKIREWLVSALPPGLTHSFGAGIGLFLTFVGLNESGIVRLGIPGSPVRVGDLSSPAVLIAIVELPHHNHPHFASGARRDPAGYSYGFGRRFYRRHRSPAEDVDRSPTESRAHHVQGKPLGGV